jgi:hypothetical protein
MAVGANGMAIGLAGDTAPSHPLSVTANSRLIKVDSNGRLGLNSTATAKLHIDAGSTSASTAPIKLTAGSLMSSPEAGAIEYDGTSFYITNGSASRTAIPTSSSAGEFDISFNTTFSGDSSPRAIPICAVGASQTAALTFSVAGKAANGRRVIGFYTVYYDSGIGTYPLGTFYSTEVRTNDGDLTLSASFIYSGGYICLDGITCENAVSTTFAFKGFGVII